MKRAFRLPSLFWTNNVSWGVLGPMCFLHFVLLVLLVLLELAKLSKLARLFNPHGKYIVKLFVQGKWRKASPALYRSSQMEG